MSTGEIKKMSIVARLLIILHQMDMMLPVSQQVLTKDYIRPDELQSAPSTKEKKNVTWADIVKGKKAENSKR